MSDRWTDTLLQPAGPSRTGETDVSLRGLCRLILRHKVKVLLTFGAVIAAAVALTARTRPSYLSEAKLFVRLGRESVVVDPTATMGQPEPKLVVPRNRQSEINSIVELLQSRVLQEAVVDRLGPSTVLGRPAKPAAPADDASAKPAASNADDSWWQQVNPLAPQTPHERAVQQLAGNLVVEAAENSSVITVGYTGPSPQLAQRVVDALVEAYLQRHMKMHRAPGADEFLDAQTEKLREDLTHTEDRLRELQNETGFASVEDQRRLSVERIGRLKDERLTAQSALAAAEGSVRALESKLAKLPRRERTAEVSGLDNPAVDGMRKELFALELQEQQLLAIYRPEAKEVRDIRRQIAEAAEIVGAEEQRRSQQTEAPSRAYQETLLTLLTKQTELESLKERKGVLDAQLADARSQLSTLNDQALEITRLQREVELKDARYRAYSENVQQARADEILEAERISNISIVQPPTHNARPVKPRVALNLALGFVAAVMAGFGVALAAERWDSSLRSAEEIERQLGLPALASIPRFKTVRTKSLPKGNGHDRAFSG